jgi:hypothetical protein
VFVDRTSVVLSVHARSVAAAAIDGVTGELMQARLTPSRDHIRSWIGRLDGPVAVTYKAGPTGFGLYRALTAAGIRRVVAAPSKLQRPSGDRVKTDAKDAGASVALLRLGELTPGRCAQCRPRGCSGLGPGPRGLPRRNRTIRPQVRTCRPARRNTARCGHALRPSPTARPASRGGRRRSSAVCRCRAQRGADVGHDH